MTIEQWERHKADNRTRFDASGVASPEPRDPTRAAMAEPGPIAVRESMPLALTTPEGTPGEIVGTVEWSPPPSTARIRVGEVFIPQQVDVVMFGSPNRPRLELTVEVRNGVPGYTRIELSPYGRL